MKETLGLKAKIEMRLAGAAAGASAPQSE